MRKALTAIGAILLVAAIAMGGAAGIKTLMDKNAQENPADEAISLQQWLLNFTVDERAEILDFVREAARNPRSYNSHPVNNEARKNATGMSDATSFGFAAYNKTATEYTQAQIDGMYTELLIEYVTNPFLGIQLAEHNRDVEIAPGITLGSLNKRWMDEGFKIYNEKGLPGFDTYHTVYWSRNGVELPANSADMPAWRAEHPTLPEPTAEETVYVTNAEGKKIVYVNEDWIQFINNNLILLMSAERTGVKTNWSTTKHYLNLPVAEWRDAHPILNTDKTYKDTLPVLTFAYVRKDGSMTGEFGHNLADKRLEEKEVETKPTTTTPPGDKPSDPPKDPPKDPPSDPPTTPPTDPPKDPPKDGEGAKDPISDPVNQGNADRGGGQNDPSNNEDPFYPEDPDNDKSQGHQDPGTTYPTTPPQDSDHQDTYVPPENNDENKMPYNPDTPPTSSWTTSNGQTTTINGSVTPSEGKDGSGPDSGGENVTQSGGNPQGSTTPDPGDFLGGDWGGPPD